MNKKSEAQARYDSANTIRVALKLNKKTDADIINKLNQQGSKTETQGECHVKMEDWSEASTSQGAPKIICKLPEGRKRSPTGAEGTWPQTSGF